MKNNKNMIKEKMRKNMKKKIMLTGLVMLFVIILCHPVSAVTESEIPEIMQPHTIIEYIDDVKYVILKGGEAVQKTSQSKSKEVYDEILKDKIIDESHYIIEELPKPKKGMKVTYASDGYILDIIMSHSEKVNYRETKVLSKHPKDTKEFSSDLENRVWLEKIAQWGSGPNILYRGLDKYIMGIGRATNFTDKIGQANHKLKKGDVATKLAYDNCKVGTKIGVKHNNKIVQMIKWDAGGMPNAIIDIWKTGVEYFGYTWKSSLSFSLVVYSHN